MQIFLFYLHFRIKIVLDDIEWKYKNYLMPKVELFPGVNNRNGKMEGVLLNFWQIKILF